MRANKDCGFPILELRTGEFGLVETNVNLIKFFDEDIYTIEKKIERFSNDDVLVANILIQSSIDNIKERVILKSIISSGNKDFTVALDFKKLTDKYVFAGMFGSFGYTNFYFDITADVYAKVKNKIIELCNPRGIFELDSIMDFLYECGNEDIYINFLRHWEEEFGKPNRKLI